MPKKRKKAKIVGLNPNQPEKTAKPSRTILGSCKVQRNHRFTLIKSVREKLNAKIGDIVVFGEDENGNLTIRIVKAEREA